MQTRVRFRLVSIIVLTVWGIAASATAQITTGNVVGTVKDSTGGVVPGATVVLVSESRGTRSLPAVSNASGDYVFPNVTGTGLSSRELADMLLNEAGVACLSGTAFGSYGDGYLRFSYANSLENIQEALSRIRKLSERWATAAVR